MEAGQKGRYVTRLLDWLSRTRHLGPGVWCVRNSNTRGHRGPRGSLAGAGGSTHARGGYDIRRLSTGRCQQSSSCIEVLPLI